jgi:hypothetical protein
MGKVDDQSALFWLCVGNSRYASITLRRGEESAAPQCQCEDFRFFVAVEFLDDLDCLGTWCFITRTSINPTNKVSEPCLNFFDKPKTYLYNEDVAASPSIYQRGYATWSITFRIFLVEHVCFNSRREIVHDEESRDRLPDFR